MAEADASINDEIARNNESDTRSTIHDGRDRPNSTRGQSATSTRTSSRGSKPTSGRNSAEENKTTQSPKLVDVAVPVAPQSEEEKKRVKANYERERRAKEKQEKARLRAVEKDTQAKTPFNITQIETILLTISAITASRPNMEHWALSQAEIKQLATPLGNILAKSDTFSGVSEYADHIALAIACFSIVIPRLMLTIQQKREETKNESTQQPNNGRQITGSDERITTAVTPSGNVLGKDLYALMPGTA